MEQDDDLGAIVKITVVGKYRANGTRFYELMASVASLSDPPVFDYLLRRLADKLAEPVAMVITPWERWTVREGIVVDVDDAIEYGPAPWRTKP